MEGEKSRKEGKEGEKRMQFGIWIVLDSLLNLSEIPVPHLSRTHSIAFIKKVCEPHVLALVLVSLRSIANRKHMQPTDTILFCTSQPKLKIYEIGTKMLSSYPCIWEVEAGGSEVPGHSGLQAT